MRARNPKSMCSLCGKYRHGGRNTKSGKCKSCWRIEQLSNHSSKIVSSFSHSASRHRHQNVRNHAHRVASVLGWKKVCRICNYSLHVELCHIRAISDFPVDTQLSVVNSPSNLCYLCPNHHWEQERKLLNLQQTCEAVNTSPAR